MCGIFGFSGAQPVDITKIRWLAVANEDRGRSSTGVYTERLDKKNTKVLVKNTDIANQFIDRMDVKEALAGANLIQGHTRAATVGAVNDANAHPFEYNLGTKCIGAHNGFINDMVNKEHQYEKFGFEKEFPVDSCLIFATLSKYNGDYNKLAEMVGAIACSFVLPDKYPGILFLYKGYGRELHTGLSKEGVYYSSERTPLRHIGCVGINPVPDNSIMMLKNGELIDVVELKPTLVKFPLGTQRTNFEDKLSVVELKRIGIDKINTTPMLPHQGGGHYRKQSKVSTPIVSNHYATSDDYVENQFRDKLGAIINDVKNEVDKLIPKPLEFNTVNSYPFSDIDSCLLLVVLKASTSKNPRLAGWTIFGKEKHTIAGITAINGVTVLRFEKEDCDKEHTLVITDPMEEGPVFNFKVTPKAKSVMEVALIIPFPQSDKGETIGDADGTSKRNQSPILWLGQSLLRLHSARFNQSRSLLPATTKDLVNVQEPIQQVCSRTEGGEVSGDTCESGTTQRNPPNIAGVYSGVHLDSTNTRERREGGVHGANESIRIPPLTQGAMRSILKLENEKFLLKTDVLRLIRGQEYSRTLSLWSPYLAAFLNLVKLFADAAVLKLHDVKTNGESYGLGYYAYRIILQLSPDNYQLYRLSEENTKYIYQCLDNISAGRTYTEAVEKKSQLELPLTEKLSHKLSLSFFKNFIEYCASITCNFGAIMYTTEKKEALIKVLKSQEALIEGQIENLQKVAHVLSTVTTLQTINVKAGLNSTLQGLRYNKLLVSQFKEELQRN